MKINGVTNLQHTQLITVLTINKNLFKLKVVKIGVFIFILVGMISFNSSIQAQVDPIDSLALVALYEQTNGPEWNDQGNWLNGPVQSWVGISLTGNGLFVESINLPGNHLVGQVPPDLTNMLQIVNINFQNNELTFFPNLTNIPSIGFINVNFNQLGYDSFEPYFEFGSPPFPFEFQNQQPIGIEIDTIIPIESTICLPNFIGGSTNVYTWLHNGAEVTDGLLMNDGSLKLPISNFNQIGEYQLTVTNEIVSPFAPTMLLFGALIFIEIAEEDSIGGLIKPRQLIVKFQDGIPNDTALDIRNEFSAIKLDSILCKDIELWGLPDTVFLPGGDTLIEIEEIKSRAAAKSKVEEVDYNHIVEDVDGLGLNKSNDAQLSSIQIEAIRSIQKTIRAPFEEDQFIMDDTIIIAIVDTGIDTMHSTLSGQIWVNKNEFFSGTDSDGNCLPDDVNGFNFEEGSTHIIDDNGHGTHIAGIVQQLQEPGHHVSLMSLRTHDDKGRGDIFAMMSAIFYAGAQGARIINISSGYYGEASTILPIAIAEAETKSQSVIVTSAGNKESNNDSIPHYPSNYRLPNLISVAALNIAEDGLAFYTNFGKSSVDIAAPGSKIISTLPGNEVGEKSGSSMAAAWVSGILANVILDEPELTAEQIVNCTKMSADPIMGGDTTLISSGKINGTSTTSCLLAVTPGLRIKLWLEGPYQSNSNLMTTSLLNQGILPPTEPFTSLGWPLTEGAGESYDTTQFSSLPVEWALFELRDAQDSSLLSHQRPVLIQSNGHVVLPNGDSVLTFNSAINADYFVAIRLLSHLDVLSSSLYAYNRTQSFVNNTSISNPVSSSNIYKIENGQAILFGGDANTDHIIDAGDRSETWNHRNEVGYLSFDVNLDGIVDAADRSLTWNNRNKIANFPQ